jgi:hypothetical protein
MAAEKVSWWSPFTSLAHLKLRVSKRFQKSKEEWDEDPHHHGTEEIPPPTKEVMHGPGKECHRSDGRTDQDWSLALRGVPQEGKEEGR